MKKLVMALLIFVLCVGLCACENESEKVPETNNESTSNQTEATELNNTTSVEENGFATIIYNDQVISIGDDYESLKNNLGEEAKPSETVVACGPGQTSNVVIHYYDNFEIHVDSENKICQFQIKNENVTLKSGIKVGQNYEEAKEAAMIEPDFEFEGYISYSFEHCMASIQYDDTNVITTISVEAKVEDEL